MTARSEYEAAYFTLLRAREEHDALLHYREWLAEEHRRIEEFAHATREREDALPRRLRRPVDQTSKGMLEALGRRRAVVADEQRKIDQRVADAYAFVEECEGEVANMRG